MMSKLIVTGCLYVILFNLVIGSEVSDDGTKSANITVSPDPIWPPKVGADVVLHCSTKIEGASVYWHMNGSRVDALHQNTSRAVDEQGTLTITDVDLLYAGEYTCATDDDKYSKKIQLTVIPSYYLASIVIMSIVACLIVLFFLCMAHRIVQERRMKSKHGKIYNGPIKVVDRKRTITT